MKYREFLACALLALLCLATTVEARCFKANDPMNPFDLTEKDCPKMTRKQKSKSNLQAQAAPQQNMFDIDLTCDDAKNRCSRVKASFEEAGAILSRTFRFKSRITVQAFFNDFCATGSVPADICERAGGAATPNEFLFVRDSDCVERLYPQALVKQFNLKNSPDFSSPDILAMFNSVFDYHFAGDDGPISADESDFTYVVLHELLHGMGFITTWRNYFDDQIVTPLPMGETADGGTKLTFVEAAFDQHMFNTIDNFFYTNLTTQLNTFPAQNTVSQTDLFASFAQSDQGKIGKKVLDYFITPNSTVFWNTVGNDQVILETTLNPYQPSSSVAHVGFDVYRDTPDFLMAFTAVPGETLEDIQKRVGGNSPIGPLTTRLMSSLGYATEENPRPYQPDARKCNGTASDSDPISGIDPTTSDGSNDGSFGTDNNNGTVAAAAAPEKVSIGNSLLVTLLLWVFLAMNNLV